MRELAKLWGFRKLPVSVALLILSGVVGMAASSPTRLTPAGLQAEYSFAEGSGSAAGDSSGSGFHSVLQNGAAFAPAGRVGFGVALDGVDDFVNLGDNRGFVQNSSAGTVALWVKPASVIASGSFRELVSLSVGGTPNPTKTSRIALSLKGDASTGGQVFFGARSTDTEGQKNVTTAQGVAVGTWTHVAGVVDYQNNTLKVYINGVVAATATGVGFASPTSANTPCRNSALGAQDDGIGNPYAGSLDQARIFNRALLDAEIQALASGDVLQAHWALDEGSGLVASDASGNQNVGTLKNGVEAGWVGGGQIAGALQFDGVDDFVQVDAPNLLRNVNAATVALWIKPSSTIPAGAFRELVSVSVGGAPSDVSRFALALRGDGTSAGDVFLGGRSLDGETQKNTLHDSSLPVGTWTHVAGVANFAQGTLEIHINGFLAASAPAAFVQPSTANTASPSIALGAQDSGGSNRFAGAMDALRCYARALTACEVQELAGRDGLEAYWKFDETSGTTAADSSPTGLAATLKNGANFVPGLRGNALNLDGVDDYADLGLNLPILSRGANAATAAAWINLGSVPPSGAFREILSIAVGGSPSNTSRLAFAIKGTAAGTADLFAGGRSTDSEPQQTLTAAAGIQPGVWRHVAATLDVGHNAIRIYLDGSQIASANVAFSQPTMPQTAPAVGAIGAQDTGDSNRIHARIDEARIYCRVLSAAEIASLAAAERPAPPILTVVEEGNQQVKLSWTTVPGTDFYNLKRSTTMGSDHITITSTGATSFTDTGLTNDVTYFYIVTANNAAGESDPSNEVPATPRAGVPPAPVITSPPSGAILNTASPTVSGTSSAQGLTITLLVDGAPNGTTVSGVAGNWTMAPALPLAEGIRNLTATATNASGTSPPSSPVQIRIDTVAPVISSPFPPDGSSITSAMPTISASWNDPAPGSGVNTASAVIKLDNVAVSASVNTSGFSFTPTSALALGSHAVSAQVSDLAGNSSAILAWSFDVVAAPTDTTPPVISNLIPADGSSTSSATPQLSAAITDSGGAGINAGSVIMTLNAIVVPAVVTLEDANNASVTFTPTTPLSQTSHVFTVDASDNAQPPNQAAQASSTFTVVTTLPPTFSLTSPPTTLVQASNLVSISGQAFDFQSTLNIATFSAFLNGNNITQSLETTVDSPSVVSFSGTVPAAFGTNTLALSINNNAGVQGTLIHVFELILGQDPGDDGETLSISIESGNNEEALVGRVLPSDLVVKVTKGGSPIAGIPVLFKVTQGDGTLVGSATILAQASNGAGLAAVNYQPTLDTNTITASFAGVPDNQTVVFTVVGKNPTITEIAPPVPLVLFPGRVGFPGGALALPFILEVKDPQGLPLKSTTITPKVVDANGNPIADFSSFGEFVPKSFPSDENGRAEFAFVISGSASFPQTIAMRGVLLSYRDADGKNIMSTTFNGGVLDPNTRVADFKYTTPQSRVSAASMEMPGELDTGAQGQFLFGITAGDGTLLPAGHFFPVTFVGGDVREARSEDGKVKYKKGPKNGPAIVVLHIETSPGTFLDAYAVAPTEVRIVRRTFQKAEGGSLARDANGEPQPAGPEPFEGIEEPRNYVVQAPYLGSNDTVQAAAPEFEFFIEAKMPTNQATAQGSIRSLALDGGPAVATSGSFIPLQKTLNLAVATPTPNYLILRSDPIVGVGPSAGSGTPTGGDVTPSGQQLLEVSINTLLEVKLTQPVVQEGEKKPAVAPYILAFGVDGMGSDIFMSKKSAFDFLFKDSDGNQTGVLVAKAQAVFPSVTLTCLASFVDGQDPKVTGGRTEMFLRDNPLTLSYLVRFPKTLAERSRQHFAHVGGANQRQMDTANMIFNDLANQTSLSDTLRRGGLFGQTLFSPKGAGWNVCQFPHWPFLAGPGFQGPLKSFTMTGDFRRLPDTFGGLTLTQVLDYVGYARSGPRATSEVLDGITEQTLIESQEKRQGKLYHLGWFGGYDHFAHDAGKNSAQLGDYLAETAVRISRVVGSLSAEVRERTYFVLFSDHGTHQLIADADHLILPKVVFKVLKDGGFTVFDNPGRDTDRAAGTMADVNTVVGFHDAMMEVFVKNRGAGKSWSDFPRFQADVLPVAALFRAADFALNGPLTGKLDMILVRDSEGAGGWGAEYKVYEEDPPTRVKLTALAAWAALHPRDTYVANWVDHLKKAAFIRSGDVMVLSKNTDSPNTTYYFWNRVFHYGHGGLSREEMEIPFAIGYLGKGKPFRDNVVNKANARPAKLGGAVNLTNMDTYILEDLLEIKKP